MLSITQFWLSLSFGFLCAVATEVYVMLPLDIVRRDGVLTDPFHLEAMLDKMKTTNITGFMVDCWWGVTERSPKSYDFSAYQLIVAMAKDRDMKVQLVTSFHQCGGNVGDDCDIPLPSFVSGTQGIWYTDQNGNEATEYVSLFADAVKIGGRTPLQMYSDWFAELNSTFGAELGSTITDIQVGMGPAGELRYPAYQLAFWQWCGIGAFQAWDQHALESFKTHAAAANHTEWTSPPTDAGDYNSRIGDATTTPQFFQDGYQSDYGKFFLNWYFTSLKDHGAAVLSRARTAFGDKIALSGKVAGIHWWYKSETHAAELTAGYYNTNQRNAYAELAEVFASQDGVFDFTCMEMEDRHQSRWCNAGPQELVMQVLLAAKSKGVRISGENALPRYDHESYRQVETYKSYLHSFTYLRLGARLLRDDHLRRFKDFVGRMQDHEGPLV